MTVKELILDLMKFNPSATVMVFNYEYGWREVTDVFEYFDQVRIEE